MHLIISYHIINSHYLYRKEHYELLYIVIYTVYEIKKPKYTLFPKAVVLKTHRFIPKETNCSTQFPSGTTPSQILKP